MSSVKELCNQLGIRHPLEQTNCIGYGQRKPTCGCAVAIASRTNAVNVLTIVNRAIRANDQVKQTDLQAIANLLLCKRFHQYQADENVQRWVKGLQKWVSQLQASKNESEGSMRLSRTSTQQLLTDTVALQAQYSNLASDLRFLESDHASLQTDYDNLQTHHENLQNLYQRLERRHRHLQSRQLCLDSVSNEALIEEVRRRLENPANQNLESSIVAISMQITQIARSNRDADIQNITDVEQSSTIDTHIGTVARSLPTPAESDTLRRFATSNDYTDQRESQPELFTQSLTQPLYQQNTTSSAAQQPRSSSPTSVESRTATLVSRQERDSVQNSEITSSANPSYPIRQSHTECSICLEPYEENVQDFWECQQCQNRVHSLCFNSWTGTQTEGRGRSCVYCRATASSQ